MPKAPLLTDAEIVERLGNRHGWERRGDSIVRTLRFKDFSEAVRFLSDLAGPADAQNHHPDVAVHWNEVTLTLWTHASGGLTERDFHLAETIDGLAKDAHAEA